MGIPNKDHIIRHIGISKLHRDADGNVHGVLPQAFQLREEDKMKLSVSWVEHFGKPTKQENVICTINTLRKAMRFKVPSKCGYGVINVQVIKDICSSLGVTNVDIVHSKTKPNPSHSSVLRLPNNDMLVMTSLAKESYKDFIFDKDV